ncbi:hypothetical protein [Actinomyces sp. MRS3W]|uniref:hypothetical protein n=1 Tax=Actinomyces sp. MRS3W TaxID=2800796 RepID=UPI0028FDC1B7|nr:hypothetical protein [Actinomyces sp. MRS3W]MDU0347678.1 hypothetical protein [Actinomyces sp. MRS3W]
MGAWARSLRQRWARLLGGDKAAIILAAVTVALAAIVLTMTPLTTSLDGPYNGTEPVEEVIAVRPYVTPDVSFTLMTTGIVTGGCAVLAWLMERTRTLTELARTAVLTVTMAALIVILGLSWFACLFVLPNQSPDTWRADDGALMSEVSWGFTQYDHIVFRTYGPFMVPDHVGRSY